MKYMITAALALALTGTAAMAQDDHHREGGGEHRAGPPAGGAPGGGRPAPAPAPAPQAAPQAGREARGGGAPDPRGPGFGQYRRGPEGGPPAPGARPGGDRGDDRRGPESRGEDRRGPDFRGDDRRGPDFGRGSDRGGPDRGGPGRGDFHGGPGFRPSAPRGFLSSHGWRGGSRFRGFDYRYPRGWGYQYFAFGAFLPSVFLAPDYSLGEYWNYGLPAPPPGFRWIRVGPDALLVRYGDGYVLDAAYGIFY